MPLEPTKHVNGRMWQPGQSGNANGHPVGSRTVFSQAFCRDLAEVWSEEGREAMLGPFSQFNGVKRGLVCQKRSRDLAP